NAYATAGDDARRKSNVPGSAPPFGEKVCPPSFDTTVAPPSPTATRRDGLANDAANSGRVEGETWVHVAPPSVLTSNSLPPSTLAAHTFVFAQRSAVMVAFVAVSPCGAQWSPPSVVFHSS